SAAYFLNILAHLVLGALLVVLVCWAWRRTGFLLLAVFLIAAMIGITIVIVGGTRSHQSIVYAHAIAAFIATLILGAQQDRRRLMLPIMTAVMLFPFLYAPDRSGITIGNPVMPPQSMDYE